MRRRWHPCPATSVQDTPQAVNVIDSATMKQQAVTTLGDALRNVPGITIAIGEGGTLAGDQFKIRGFDAKDDVYLDGLRDFGAYTRDSFNYEEVQVLKGPSGLMFGRGTTGGAINTISKTPFLRRQIFRGAGRRQWRPCPRHRRPELCLLRHRRGAPEPDGHRHRRGGPRFRPFHPLGHRAHHRAGPGHRHPMVAGLYAPAYRRPSRLRPGGGAAPRPADRRAGQRIWRAAQHLHPASTPTSTATTPTSSP